jgi:hypothetical protein
MQLRYRGLSYESNEKVIETELTGSTATYRGTAYEVRSPVNLADSQPIAYLQYRGVAYTQSKTPAIKPPKQPKSGNLNQSFS